MRLKQLSVLSLLALSTLAGPVLAAGKATVSGVVNDGNGKGVAKATVQLLHREGQKLEETDSATTNSKGEFKITGVDDGTYVVVASSRDRELRDRSEITVHDGRDPGALTFEIRPGKASKEEVAAEKSGKSEKKGHVNFVGAVVDKNGKGIEGVTVRLLTGDNDEDTDKLTTVDTVTSEAKGRFEFYKVVFGHYVVDVRKGSLHTHKAVTLKETDGTQSIEITLK